MPSVQFGVLGPISAWSEEGDAVRVGGPRQRCVLGALLVDLGREVTVERLIDFLWDDDPPRTARSVVQVQISHLRRAFPDMIQTTAGGYLARVDPARVDLHRFRQLTTRAQAASGSEEALALWEDALACWRGHPFSGTGSETVWYTVCQPLLEERWVALTSWAECAFSLGHYTDVVTRLTPLVREDPLRERLQYLLIASLYQSGQRASALTVFHETQQHLSEELGVDPSSEVMELHQRILKDTEAVAAPSPATVDTVPLRVEPAAPPSDPEAEAAPEFVSRNDLPRDIPDFTGREGDLKNLLDLGRKRKERAEVAVVTGPGGAGKTTLAVHAAHRLDAEFPDGQFFIDLYGYNVDQDPLTVSSALGSLLRAVGVEPDAIPESVEERSALWRAMLAGRKCLVVLDNAASFAQVSPLLPAAAGSLTVVTTRQELPGLSGVQYLSLGMLGEDASLRLFSTVLGAHRVEGEYERALAVARLCGGLPLALRIIAGRMLSRPRWTFEHVEKRLSEHQRRFRELRVDGQSVEAVFELSYQSLDIPHRNAFLTLGAMLGGSIDLYGAAVLLDRDLPESDDLLQELVSVCLLDELGVDLYRFHDLIGTYARHKALQELPGFELENARLRLADHYLDMANRAAAWLGPRAHEYDTERINASRYRSEISSVAEAISWFERHQENLASAVDFYAVSEEGEKAWKLADSLWRFYASHGETELLLSTHEKALSANRSQGNQRGSAVTLIGLGIAHCLAGRFDVSLRLLVEARDILSSLGDREGEVRAYGNLVLVYERMGRFHDALSCLWTVLEYAVSVGDRHLETLQRLNISVVYHTLGECERAARFAEEALQTSSEEEHTTTRSGALRILGEINTTRGHYDQALAQLDEGLQLAQFLGVQTREIYIHNSRAVALRESGALDSAIESHLRALELGEETEQRSAEAEVRVDLGDTYTRAHRHTEAYEAHAQGLRLARERNERHIEGRALLGIGSLPEESVPADDALAHVTAAAEIFDDLGVPEAQRAREALRRLRG
ncbi:DNA-binding SARP family transcriptional activator [Haloactinospora alba]|uniref:DNA-binding SARP family transcriptional activator n=1 Tax=Haloactinospora alba TaxID=405555 RepID=A0A543NA22_9ACTN|nr:DNA-binding SARP family transcriptional activator [Haloactinospora alba]